MAEWQIPKAPFDVQKIMEILPHRWPFLLVDRILELGEKHIVGEKCITMNEWQFVGHLPGRPIMPGVLMVEAMAQTGAVHTLVQPDMRDKLALLAGVDEARFRRVVVPDDRLRIEMEEIARKARIGKTRGRVLVDGELAVEAVITFAISPRKTDQAG